MGLFNKSIRSPIMFGQDGNVRVAYAEGKSYKDAKKKSKELKKQLNKFEKEFIDYASYDINLEKMYSKNDKYIFGRFGIFSHYLDSPGAICDNAELEEAAMFDSKDEGVQKTIEKGLEKQGIANKLVSGASNTAASIRSGLSSALVPKTERLAAKHPRFKPLSDLVTKIANGGRMPLTADSAAAMRIAFDRKYYRDIRKPHADIEALHEQYTAAISGLEKAAERDGVDFDMMSSKLGEKVLMLSKTDPKILDIYDGFATGDIRLEKTKPILDRNGKEVRRNGKIMYKLPRTFVNAEGEPVKSWNALTPRELMTVEKNTAAYKSMLEKGLSSCKSAGEICRYMASDSFAYIESNAKRFAEDDCPGQSDEFKKAFKQSNLECLKAWGVEHNDEVFAKLKTKISGKQDLFEGVYDDGDEVDSEDVADENIEHTESETNVKGDRPKTDESSADMSGASDDKSDNPEPDSGSKSEMNNEDDLGTIAIPYTGINSYNHEIYDSEHFLVCLPGLGESIVISIPTKEATYENGILSFPVKKEYNAFEYEPATNEVSNTNYPISGKDLKDWCNHSNEIDIFDGDVYEQCSEAVKNAKSDEGLGAKFTEEAVKASMKAEEKQPDEDYGKAGEKQAEIKSVSKKQTESNVKSDKQSNKSGSSKSKKPKSSKNAQSYEDVMSGLQNAVGDKKSETYVSHANLDKMKEKMESREKAKNDKSKTESDTYKSAEQKPVEETTKHDDKAATNKDLGNTTDKGEEPKTDVKQETQSTADKVTEQKPGAKSISEHTANSEKFGNIDTTDNYVKQDSEQMSL